jgi:hypothetical protein
VAAAGVVDDVVFGVAAAEEDKDPFSFPRLLALLVGLELPLDELLLPPLPFWPQAL